MKGRIKDVLTSVTGEIVLSLEITSGLESLDDLFDKDLSIELKEWRKKRSLDRKSVV